MLKICNDIDAGTERLEPGEMGDDLAEIRVVAHKMAGTAALVGATALHSVLARIETGCKTDDASLVTGGMDELADIAGKTVSELRQLVAAE